MKKVITAAALLFLYSTTAAQPASYTGKIKVNGPGMGDADIFLNDITVTVAAANAAQVTFHFNGRSPHQNDKGFSVLDMQGTVSGLLQNNKLTAKGWINSELNDGNAIDKAKRYVVVKATLGQATLEGKIYVYMKEAEIRTDAFFSFTAGGPPQPELVFPLGKSPKIFNTGWVLGARFILKDEKGNNIDLSSQVQWSGTAVFTPATGKEVHPVFNRTGKNTVILTVLYNNKKYQSSFTADVVNALDYARVGSISECAADIHGCPMCPHRVEGMVTTGSAKVLIAGKPAAVTGSTGIHVTRNSKHTLCCGPNTFTVTEGDPLVLIDGKPVAKLGSITKHCGGAGRIVALRDKE